MEDRITVDLIPWGTTPDPLKAMYLAFRVDYSALTPMQVVKRMEDERITEADMLDFINKRFETGHASPLQQVIFQFGISGVSRAFSHQFVRHHIGIDFEQQSQRYVTFTDKRIFPYTTPDTVVEANMEVEFAEEMQNIDALYHKMVDAGIPGEDARFALPNATNTNFVLTVNFLELQHILDLRLCIRAQWEFRKVAAKMRAEINRAYPWLGAALGIKCQAHRKGYCDESFADWEKCPISKVRPHKSQVIPA